MFEILPKVEKRNCSIEDLEFNQKNQLSYANQITWIDIFNDG